MADWKSYTSFLGSHWTYTQQNSDSCGPSCVMMMIRKRTNVLISEKDAFLAYDSYGNPTEYSNPDGVVIREYQGDEYTSAVRLARTIRTLIGNAKHEWNEANDVGQVIKAKLKTGPLIGLVSWQGGGGHFVMLDSGGMSNGKFYAAACDPWDGAVRLIEIKGTGPLKYMPDYPDTIKAQGQMGGGKSTGHFNGWLVL